MSKKILVLTGSPRKGGNSDLMADALIRGAKAAGHTVTKFETSFKNIKPCRACNTCFSKGVACSFNDDFNELAPLLEQFDILALVTPLYWYSFPTQLKAAIDKFYALNTGNRPWKITECMLLVCGADTQPESFAGIIKTYELIASYRKWKDIGQLIVPGVWDKGAIKSTHALADAEQMGRHIQ